MRAAMRYLISGIVLMGASHGAFAQSETLPELRGSSYRPVPPTYRNWSGFYAGGQIGYSSGNAEIAEGGSSLLANALRFTALEQQFEISTWPNPQLGSNNAAPFGGFVGYNWQSDNAVFGVEFNYNHTKHSFSATDLIARQVTAQDEFRYDITVTSNITAKLSDYGSMRMRAGAVYNNMLPYLTVGLAVGRVSVSQTGSASYPAPTYTGTTIPAPPNPGGATVSDSRNKNNVYAWGISAGAGVDWEVMPHVFLRGEYEYAGFAAVNDVNIAVHTARVGAAVRF